MASTQVPNPIEEAVLKLADVSQQLSELLANQRSFDETPCELSQADIDGANTSFRYRTLSALMGKRAVEELTVEVTIDVRTETIAITRPDGFTRGTHLSFVAGGETVVRELEGGVVAKVCDHILQGHDVDTDSFLLLGSARGPVVAIGIMTNYAGGLVGRKKVS